MRISMRRGDIKWIRFLVNIPSGITTDIDFTNIYFTVKKKTTDKSYLFQKSLQRNEIYKLDIGDYQFKIDAADTERLNVGEYKFDIQLSYLNLLKESFVGDLILKEEVTYIDNEDYVDGDASIPSSANTYQETTILEIPDYHIITLSSPDIVTTETSDYNELFHKPIINNVELKGSLSLEDLGIQPGETLIPFTDEELEDIVENTEGE